MNKQVQMLFLLFSRFVGGQLNTCYNALDLHVEQGRGDKTALIWDSPVSGNVKKFTYKELRDEVRYCIWYGGKFLGMSGLWLPFMEF